MSVPQGRLPIAPRPPRHRLVYTNHRGKRLPSGHPERASNNHVGVRVQATLTDPWCDLLALGHQGPTFSSVTEHTSGTKPSMWHSTTSP